MWSVAYCKKCGVKSNVIDSRPTKTSIHRRRQCPQCKTKWGTREVFDDRSTERLLRDIARLRSLYVQMKIPLDTLEKLVRTDAREEEEN